MNLRSYLATIRRQAAIILVLALLGAGLGAARYLTENRVYASTLQFYVSTPLSEGANAQAADEFAQNRVNSYVRLFGTQAFAERVIEESGVDLGAAQVIGRIRASAAVGTVLIVVRVSDTDPQRVQDLAAAVATSFPPMVDELDNVGRSSQLVRIILVTPPSQTVQLSPDRNRLLVMGFAVGLLAGIAAAAARELLDRRVHGSATLPELTGVPNLAELPATRTQTTGPLLFTDPTDAGAAESLRRVRAGLSASVLITSAAPGDGRSTVATNLALLLARLDRRVLLVDADLRSRDLSATFGLNDAPGLAEVLTGTGMAAELARQHESTSLWVLGAGQTDENPADLMARSNWPELLAALEQQYQHVVIDSPPIGFLTDGIAIAEAVDDVLLVVRDANSTREQVRSAAAALSAIDAPLSGTILNLSRAQRPNRAARIAGPAASRAETGTLRSPNSER